MCCSRENHMIQKKSTYGPKQSLQAWFEIFYKVLGEIGICNSKKNHFIFIKKCHQAGPCWLLISIHFTKWEKKKSKKFSLKIYVTQQYFIEVKLLITKMDLSLKGNIPLIFLKRLPLKLQAYSNFFYGWQNFDNENSLTIHLNTKD